MIKPYVLDASALVQLIDDGRDGAERMERLLQAAQHKKIPLVMSVLNWGEIFYQIWQRSGEEKARQTMGKLSRLLIELVPVDLFQALKAGEIKALYKLPYVDCFAAALAEIRLGILVTSDRDFEKLGRRIEILWLVRS